jgi:hypothetical protein
MSQTVGVTYPPPVPAPPPAAAGRSWARAVAVSLTVFVLAGVVAGWAWQHWAPLAHYVVDASGGSMNEEEMTRVFAPDGLFTAIGFLTALVLAAALFWWLRDSGPIAVAVVVLGAAAGAGVTWGLGMLLGHDALDPRLVAAKPGDLVAAPLELHGWSAMASWPLGAALAVAIIAALSWRQEHVTIEQAARQRSEAPLMPPARYDAAHQDRGIPVPGEAAAAGEAGSRRVRFVGWFRSDR